MCVVYSKIPLPFRAKGITGATPQLPCLHLLLRWAFIGDAEDFRVEFDVAEQAKMMGIGLKIIKNLGMARKIFNY